MAKGEEKARELALEMAVELARINFSAMSPEGKPITTTKILAEAAEFLTFLTA